MQYRTDLKSGNKLSALGFGCMRLPGGYVRVDMPKAEALLTDAVKRGVNYFDTAYLYPGSEEALGEILEKNKLREKVFIATKLPHGGCRKPADFDKFFETQKKRLRTGYVDYYMCHNITEASQWERLCGFGIEKWVAAKKASGEIKQFGFSFHGSYHEFEKLLNLYNWDFVQIQFNYVNVNYQAGLKGLRLAESKGIAVIIMEPLLGGKLANLPKQALRIFQKAKPGSSATEWALRYIWDEPGATVILSGMNKQAQLDENIATAKTALPGNISKGDRKAITDVKAEFNKSYKIPCTGCNYCMPCPKGINIPTCFEAYNSSHSLGRFVGLQQYMTSIGIASAKPHFVSDCIKCGVCVKKCPQGINIPDELVNVRKRLQPPGTIKLLSLFNRLRSKDK